VRPTLAGASVVLILGVAAWVALPAAAPTAPFALERATESFARAIRFARDESLRTDAPFGVEVDTVPFNRNPPSSDPKGYVKLYSRNYSSSVFKLNSVIANLYTIAESLILNKTLKR